MYFSALIVSFALVIIGIISIFNSENGLFQNLFAIISIIGSIVILLAIIGDILAFNDDNSQLTQFQQNVKNITSELKTSFGSGFGLAIASLVFIMLAICLSCRS